MINNTLKNKNKTKKMHENNLLGHASSFTNDLQYMRMKCNKFISNVDKLRDYSEGSHIKSVVNIEQYPLYQKDVDIGSCKFNNDVKDVIEKNYLKAMKYVMKNV